MHEPDTANGDIAAPPFAVEPPNRWLTPGVKGIGAASLLADLGHEVPTALLPSFLTSTLGAPAAALGAIEGVSDGLAGVARLGGGALADDPERRRTVAVGGYATRRPGSCSPTSRSRPPATCKKVVSFRWAT